MTGQHVRVMGDKCRARPASLGCPLSCGLRNPLPKKASCSPGCMRLWGPVSVLAAPRMFTCTHFLAQGELEITTEAGTGKAAAANAQGEVGDLLERVPFLMLALDLPPAPLYKDALEKNIIPQVTWRPLKCHSLNCSADFSWSMLQSFRTNRSAQVLGEVA